MVSIDLSKQQALDADPKAIQQINITENLDRTPITNTTIFSIIKKAKNSFRFFTKNQKTILILFLALI